MRLQVPASSNLKLFQLILDTYQNVRTICHPPPYPQLWIYLLRNYHSSRKPQIMGTSLLLGSKRLLCSLDGPQLLCEGKKDSFLIRISRCVFIPFVFLRLRTYYVLEGQTLPGVRRSPFLVFLCLGRLLLLILERTTKCHEAPFFSWV